MGQKVNPNSFRLQVTKSWKSRWFARKKDYAKFLNEDIRVRDYIYKNLGSNAGVSDVHIERDANMMTITIKTSKPGVIIGRGGAGVNDLRKKISQMVESRIKEVVIEDVKSPDFHLSAKIVADGCKEQLEKRVAFKRVGKQAVEKMIREGGALGARVTISGRLNGAEIARSQSFQEGKIPMSTLRANVDYALSEARTTYGILGIKVWVYKANKEEDAENVNA